MNSLWSPRIAQWPQFKQLIINNMSRWSHISNTIYHNIRVFENNFLQKKCGNKSGSILPSEIMISTNFNLPYPCRFHKSYSFSSWMGLEEKIFKFFSIYSYVKTQPPPSSPNPTPGVHDLNKLECALHEDASTQVTTFLVKTLWRRRSLKIFLYIFLCKNLPPPLSSL